MGGKSHSKSSEKSELYGKVVFLFVLFLFFLNKDVYTF